MNPAAYTDLLNLIMLDDFVARKKALDRWSKRWLVTLKVEHIADSKLFEQMPEKANEISQNALLKEASAAILKNEAKALWVGRGPAEHTPGVTKTILMINLIRVDPMETP